jgi:hypothetical protein
MSKVSFTLCLLKLLPHQMGATGLDRRTRRMELPRRTKADAVLDNYAAIARRIVVIDRGA